MNQKLKQIGLLAMLPLLTVAFSSEMNSEAAAAEEPFVQITGVTQKGDSSYWVLFQVHVGTEPLPDGKLLITSDSDSKEALYRSTSAGSIAGVSNVLIGIDDKDSLRVSLQDLEPEVDPLPVTRHTK